MGGARIDAAEIGGQRLPRDLGDGAGHFDAGGAAADDDEGEQAAAAWPGPAMTSACSKAIRMLRRMRVASSMRLRPGAKSAHSSWPK